MVDKDGIAVISDQSKADTVSSILETVRFTEGDIIAAINKLKPNLSSGPDRLPPMLFKKLKHTLSYPLSLIFAQLLSVGYVPDDWTKAIIVPVYKKGCLLYTSDAADE